MRAYHFGLVRHAVLVAGHGGADLEVFVKDGRVNLVTQESLLCLGLLALARPNDNDGHPFGDGHPQRLNLQVDRQVLVAHICPSLPFEIINS